MASRQGYVLVLFAATLWGTYPILVRLLLAGVPGLTPVDLATLRAGLGFVLLVVPLRVWFPHLLRVRRADLPFFALHGTIGIAAFYAVYAEAIARNSVAVAVVLLYTSPAWVTLLAWRLYGEPLDRRKLLALGATFAGAALVAGVSDPRAFAAGTSPLGVLIGLGSGLTWGMYSVLAKRSVGRYSPWTVLVYALGIGTLGLLAAEAAAGALPPPTVLTVAGVGGLLVLALGPTLGALAAYTEGLRRLPASVASILATWEPAVGTLLGFVVLGEALAPSQLAGAGLVLAGVLVLALPARRPPL